MSKLIVYTALGAAVATAWWSVPYTRDSSKRGAEYILPGIATLILVAAVGIKAVNEWNEDQ